MAGALGRYKNSNLIADRTEEVFSTVLKIKLENVIISLQSLKGVSEAMYYSFTAKFML